MREHCGLGKKNQLGGELAKLLKQHKVVKGINRSWVQYTLIYLNNYLILNEFLKTYIHSVRFIMFV